eukprot:5951662-Amphidinium_carterae.1
MVGVSFVTCILHSSGGLLGRLLRFHSRRRPHLMTGGKVGRGDNFQIFSRNGWEAYGAPKQKAHNCYLLHTVGHTK